jgi:hypothetical protein
MYRYNVDFSMDYKSQKGKKFGEDHTLYDLTNPFLFSDIAKNPKTIKLVVLKIFYIIKFKFNLIF